jgi:hypothetical protein
MNRSNNKAQAEAESEEGRPRIKENVSPTYTPPTQSGERVSQGLAGVRKAAKERKFYIRIRVFALTPSIQDKSRMREIRSYGSVRGASGNRCPYRDPYLA